MVRKRNRGNRGKRGNREKEIREMETSGMFKPKLPCTETRRIKKIKWNGMPGTQTI